jgi:hypothetical protein
VVLVAAAALEDPRWLLAEAEVLLAPAPQPSSAMAAAAPTANRLGPLTIFDRL